jgi:hypothetical protein
MENPEAPMNVHVLYEGDDVRVYRVEEGDEVGYDLNLFDTITLHFLREEWEEFLQAMHSLSLKD